MCPSLLKIDVLKLADGPITVEVDEPASVLDLVDDPQFKLLGRLTGKLTFTKVGGDVLARGVVSVRVHANCVRCLEDIEFDLATKVLLVFSSDKALLDRHYEGSVTQDVVYYDGIELSPIPDLRELVLLELPSYPSCELTDQGTCAVQLPWLAGDDKPAATTESKPVSVAPKGEAVPGASKKQQGAKGPGAKAGAQRAAADTADDAAAADEPAWKQVLRKAAAAAADARPKTP